MKKYFVILFFIVSVLFFLISVKEVYSVSVGQPGDMVSCKDNFKYCTDGGCTQTDRTFAIRCKIRNCSNGCKKYNNNRCIKWSYRTLNCAGVDIIKHFVKINRSDNYEYARLIKSGHKIILDILISHRGKLKNFQNLKKP